MTAMTSYAGRPRRSPTPLRLTRRGRALAVALLAVFAFVAFSLGRASTSQATHDTPAPRPLPATVVREGDTLWQIARRVAPQADPREVVTAIRELNRLGAAAPRAGQRLVLPR